MNETQMRLKLHEFADSASCPVLELMLTVGFSFADDDEDEDDDICSSPDDQMPSPERFTASSFERTTIRTL